MSGDSAGADPPGRAPGRRAELALLATVLAGAALARGWQLDYGLPDVTRVDAYKFVAPAAQWARTGELALGDYQYPGLYPVLLAGLYAGLGVRTAFAQHLVACAVAAAFGTATVWATWLAAAAWCGVAGRALAAALVAVSPILVTYSRVPASDGVVAFFFAAALACVARRPEAWTAAAAAGACIGLATGTEFSGVLGLPLVLGALALRDLRARRAGRLLADGTLALLAFGAAFWLTTPWFFAHAEDYARRLAAEMLIQGGGRIGRVQAGFFDYLTSSTPTWEAPWLGSSLLGTEGPLVLAALFAALAWVLVRRPRPDGLLAAVLCVVVAYAVQAGPGRLKAIRFLAPLLPLGFAAIGWLVDRELARLAPRRALVPLLGVALLAVPAIPDGTLPGVVRRAADPGAGARLDPRVAAVGRRGLPGAVPAREPRRRPPLRVAAARRRDAPVPLPGRRGPERGARPPLSPGADRRGAAARRPVPRPQLVLRRRLQPGPGEPGLLSASHRRLRRLPRAACARGDARVRGPRLRRGPHGARHRHLAARACGGAATGQRARSALRRAAHGQPQSASADGARSAPSSSGLIIASS
jgi:4-amino-4-deoxy-L-arabinose transferase-like glycosyltransferase